MRIPERIALVGRQQAHPRARLLLEQVFMLYHIAWYVRQHQHIALSAIALIGAITLAGAILALSSVRPLVQPLGDSTAPRVESTAVTVVLSAPPVIRPAAAPASVDPNSGSARPSADRGLLATRMPDEEYAAAALAAIECAGDASITRDTTLDAAAAALWQASMTSGRELPDVTGNRYAYVAAVPVTLAPGLAVGVEPDAACPFAGTDFGQLAVDDLTAVGVAVFADTDMSDGMDDSTVMIVGR